MTLATASEFAARAPRREDARPARPSRPVLTRAPAVSLSPVRSCNQCYKFETHTDMEAASASDLEAASEQGTLLAIEYDGTWYGNGTVGDVEPPTEEEEEEEEASHDSHDEEDAAAYGGAYADDRDAEEDAAAYGIAAEGYGSSAASHEAVTSSRSAANYEGRSDMSYAFIGGAALLLFGVALAVVRRAYRRRVVLAGDEGISMTPSTTCPPLV